MFTIVLLHPTSILLHNGQRGAVGSADGADGGAEVRSTILNDDDEDDNADGDDDNEEEEEEEEEEGDDSDDDDEAE